MVSNTGPVRSALLGLLVVCLGVLGTAATGAELTALETFANPDDLTDVTLSPNGQYLAEVRHLPGGGQVVFVLDLAQGVNTKPRPVLADKNDQNMINWCTWATNARLVCSYRGFGRLERYVLPVVKWFAVDVDGGHRIQLMENAAVGSDEFDSVIDWNSDTPNNILLEGPASLLSAAATGGGRTGVIGQTMSEGVAVFQVDVVTGQLKILVPPYGDIEHVISDSHGHPRLAIAQVANEASYQYFVRPEGGHSWTRLLKIDAYARGNKLRPIAINPQNPDLAYAIGASNGRTALWSIDLSDKQPPQLIYAHNKVDIAQPLLLKDGTLWGVLYQTERPHVFYVDQHMAAIMKSVDAALPDTFNLAISATKDQRLIVIRATSDTEPGAYYLFDAAKLSLVLLGQGNPELQKAPLGRMLSMSYPARDGTLIPGYLTTPPGVKPEHLPLIVMPHGGPIARDSWEYFFLQQFLVSRGYAVLQMNFRGSGGYGDQWYRAAFEDWGGVTYDDIVDGARWAISSGLADPKRVAIVGWSFGGYAALLGATRNSDLFRCAISISGLSDLSLLEHEAGDNPFTLKQVGTDKDKLRADSPRRHADAVGIPILMIHGDLDAQADVDQSRTMASALKSAGKAYDYVEIKDADHQMHRKSDRTQLLGEVEKFLNTNMPADAAP